MRTHLRMSRLLFLAIGVLLIFSIHPRAEAQFRLGLGLGYGFGGFNYRPNQVSYINQRSLLNASRATMGPVPWNLYANDSGAYYKHLHDPGYLERIDAGTRREIEARIGRFSDGPPPSRLARRDLSHGPVVVDRRESSPPAPRRASREAGPASEPVVRPTPQSVSERGLHPVGEQVKAGRQK